LDGGGGGGRERVEEGSTGADQYHRIQTGKKSPIVEGERGVGRGVSPGQQQEIQGSDWSD